MGVGDALTNAPKERLHWHQGRHTLSLFIVRSQRIYGDLNIAQVMLEV